MPCNSVVSIEVEIELKNVVQVTYNCKPCSSNVTLYISKLIELFDFIVAKQIINHE